MSPMPQFIFDEELAKAKAASKNYIVVRITADAHEPYPVHAAYGPITKDEALQLMDAGHKLFCHLGLCIQHRSDGRCLTAWHKGSSITWKLLMVELRDGTEDVMDGIE